MLKLFVIGNLGKDATINQYDGKTVINFSVAHTEKYKDKNGNNNSKVTWVECAYWSANGIAAYLTKGSSVFVEGVPEVNVFTKQDGTTGSSIKLRVTNVTLLGGGKQSNEQQQPQSDNSQSVKSTIQTVAADDGDLPF